MLKESMEQKLIIEKEIQEAELTKQQAIKEHFKGRLELFSYLKMLKNITQFLDFKSLANLKLANKAIYTGVVSDIDILDKYYKNLLHAKNIKIQELSKFDVGKFYNISSDNSEIEKLLREYVIGKKVPGKDLRSSVIKALGFLNKDVKGPLGMKVNTISSTSSGIHSGMQTPGGSSTKPTSTATTNFLGGIGNMLSGSLFGSAHAKSPTIPTTTTTTNNKTGDVSVKSSGSHASSRGMSIAISGNISDNVSEIEKYDKFLIHENLQTGDNFSIIDFEFATPDEIKHMLNKFLKSSNFNKFNK
jgi:hypothetical protein